MHVLVTILILLIICYFAVSFTKLYLYARNKKNHGGMNNKLRWYFGWHYYEIDIPPMFYSPYYQQTHNFGVQYLPYFPTLDDPVLRQIAEDFDELMKGRTDNYKILCLQAMVQQNVRYVSDVDRFGKENVWCFPIQTLITKMGDCEDSAILYVSLATLIGLDAIFFYYSTHTYAGVYLDIGCAFYPLELTKYCPGFLPSSNVKGAAVIFPSEPTETFKQGLYKYWNRS